MLFYGTFVAAVILQSVADQTVNISISAVNISAVAGYNATVGCTITVGQTASLAPVPGQQLPNNEIMFRNGSLTIYNLYGLSRAEDNRLFWCEYGQITSLTATLRVWYQESTPQFTSGGNQTQFVSDKLNLSVRIIANPRPTVTWYRNNEISTGYDSLSFDGDTGMTSLIIPSLKFADEGYYNVFISNIAKNDSFGVNVKVTAAPSPTPTGKSASETPTGMVVAVLLSFLLVAAVL